MKVKICGITRLEDAVTAVALGADMIGLNFYAGSKRYISPEKAANLINALRTNADNGSRMTAHGSRLTAHGSRLTAHGFPLLIGVFVNAPLDEVTRIMAHCGLDLAQLCGDEPAEMLHLLKGKAFKAIRPSTPHEADQLVQTFALFPHKPAILIDAYQPGEYGGSGQTGDWRITAHVARVYPLMLAGGLTPQNVGTAVQQVQPWGVDVASGVESAPGVKDARKMAQFIANAKTVNREP